MNNDIPDTAALRALLDAMPEGPWRVALSQPNPDIRTAAGWEVVHASYDDHLSVLEFIAAARNALPALLERLGQYEGAITWGTSCLSCSKVLDGAYQETVRAEEAEKALAAAREENAGLVADLNAVMAQRDKALSAASREVAVNAEVAAAREELAEARRERDHLRRVLDAANATTESAQRIVAAALADGTATFLPAINSAGVGVGNCNCQAIKGTPNFPGPWHPRGDTPTCPKAAVPANGGQPCPECGASGDESCRTPGGVRRWDHTGRAPQTGDGEQAAEASTDNCTCDLNLRTQCATCRAANAEASTDGQDTGTFCGHPYIGNEGEFTCDLYTPHNGRRHWNSLAEFGWGNTTTGESAA
jgi:hypothetical protein